MGTKNTISQELKSKSKQRHLYISYGLRLRGENNTNKDGYVIGMGYNLDYALKTAFTHILADDNIMFNKVVKYTLGGVKPLETWVMDDFTPDEIIDNKIAGVFHDDFVNVYLNTNQTYKIHEIINCLHNRKDRLNKLLIKPREQHSDWDISQAFNNRVDDVPFINFNGLGQDTLLDMMLVKNNSFIAYYLERESITTDVIHSIIDNDRLIEAEKILTARFYMADLFYNIKLERMKQKLSDNERFSQKA